MKRQFKLSYSIALMVCGCGSESIAEMPEWGATSQALECLGN